MTRLAIAALAAGILCFAVLIGLSGTAAVLPSYLAAWLFLIGLPLGALPILMGLELLGIRDLPVEAPLRSLVAWLPLAAVAALPLALHAAALYPDLRTPRGGGFGWWTDPAVLLGRSVLVLAVWIALSVVFARPAPAAPRYRAAVLGLILHAVMGTLALTDWAMAVEPAFSSDAFGLLGLVAQSGAALSLAVLIGWPGPQPDRPGQPGRTDEPGRPGQPDPANLLLILFGAWLFLHFTQYLVIWSANLPAEASWYLRRAAGAGAWLEAAAGLGCVAVAGALLSPSGSRNPGVIAAAASIVLVLHAVEMLWLVTPAFRGTFDVTAADLLGLVGAGAIGLGCTRLIETRRIRHAVA